LKNSVKKILAIVGPGLFLIGYNIGTGSVTTMATAGSRWGMSLTWTVVLSCLFTFIGIWAFSRYTLTTGETILSAIRKRFPFGNMIAFFIMSAIIFGEYMSITGLMSIVVDLSQEWILYTLGYKSWIIKLIITILLSLALFAILWKGKYDFLEKVLAVLVAVMGIAFIATAFLIVPAWGVIVSGLIPIVPKESNATLIIAGMAGTTFSSAILYCRSITIKEKGWTLINRGKSMLDTVVSVASMFVLSIAVMICAAGTLYVIGKPVEETVDMIKILEPLSGHFAITLFAIGVVGAGVSSLIPTILIAPWVISDFTDRKVNPGSKENRIFVIVGTFVALAGPYIGTKPVVLMILTMALLAIILPLSTIVITVLLNQKHLGKLKANVLVNTALFATIIFSFIMAYFGVVGIIEYF
jgi:manganese transport protein